MAVAAAFLSALVVGITAIALGAAPHVVTIGTIAAGLVGFRIARELASRDA